MEETEMTKTSPYDSAEFLNTPAAIEFYMAEALETGDPAFIMHALGVVARAKSMSDIARKTGLARENLYKTLSATGSPEFSTVLRVLKALDLKLTIQPKPAKATKPLPTKGAVRKKRVKAAA
jgi:probable addiction module antidote protein